MSTVLVESTNTILHRPTTPVDDQEFLNDSAELKPIAALLIKSLYENQALGVSACQIGIDKSMFVMEVNQKLTPGDGHVGRRSLAGHIVGRGQSPRGCTG